MYAIRSYYDTKTEQTLKQINDIISNTKNFDKFSQHIPSFNDALAVEKGYIAMSNSENHLKIKCDEDSSADNLVITSYSIHYTKLYDFISLK